MTAIEIARKIASAFEGLRLKPYLCPAGKWTIGRGHLCSKDHPPITAEQADAYMTQDLTDALRGVLRHCPGLLAKDAGKLGAIIDFVFNLGAGRLQYSTLRRRINQRDWPEVRYELSRWVRGGGKILPGLVARRAVESKYIGD